MDTRPVVVATDFSASSTEAVAFGRRLARRFGAPLHLVHVVDDVLTSYYGVEGPVPQLALLQQTAADDAHAELDLLISRSDRRALRAQGVVLIGTQVGRALVDYARTVQALVLVLGTHGRTGLAHFFLGSVAERVVRTAACPVLTVRQPIHETHALVAAESASGYVGAGVSS